MCMMYIVNLSISAPLEWSHFMQGPKVKGGSRVLIRENSIAFVYLLSVMFVIVFAHVFHVSPSVFGYISG